MAKASSKTVKTLGDKLAKVNENFSINMYDNGFMIEVSGKDDSGDWKTAKIMCDNLEEVAALIKEAREMERD